MFIGPMFSGKSTNLTNKFMFLENQNKILLKPKIDSRSQDSIVLHSGEKIKAHTINTTIADFIEDNRNILKPKTTFFIDECQFIENIYDDVRILINNGHDVYLAGLNSDFKQEPFNDFLNCIAFASKVIFLTSECQCGSRAIFTKRLSKTQTQVLIGGNNEYIPVCDNCLIN